MRIWHECCCAAQNSTKVCRLSSGNCYRRGQRRSMSATQCEILYEHVCPSTARHWPQRWPNCRRPADGPLPGPNSCTAAWQICSCTRISHLERGGWWTKPYLALCSAHLTSGSERKRKYYAES